MKDGRVMICGGQIDNHAEWEKVNGWYVGEGGGRNLSIEIYTPDYLWRGPRPVFAHTPDNLNMGDNLLVRLESDWTWDMIDPNRVLLIKLCSATHSQSIDQRCVGLRIDRKSDVEATLNIQYLPNVQTSAGKTTQGQVLTPGYYYLFICSLAGTPSLGHILKIGLPSLAISVQINPNQGQ